MRALNLIFEALNESRNIPYLRFGDLPEGGVSKIGRAPNWLAGQLHRSTEEELGVSVYNIEWNEQSKRWDVFDVGNYASLDELLAQRRPAYLVTGDHVIDPEDGHEAYGIDGEPLLTNVRIIKQIPYNEIGVPAWGGNPLPEEYMEETFAEYKARVEREDAAAAAKQGQ